MFLSYTPNPCFERTLLIKNFSVGGSFRLKPEQSFIGAGGKGINSARVCANFGQPSLILAPIGIQQISQFQGLLNTANISTELIETQSLTRSTINIVHENLLNDSKTEIVEAGVAPALSVGTQIFEKWLEILPKCELATIGGSYPLSDEAGWTLHSAILCQMAAKAGKRVIYDGKGEAFKRAVDSSSPPWAIKPNLQEAAELLDRHIETPAQERGAIRHFLNRGIEVVLLSCGKRGLYVGYNRQIEFFHAPTVQEISSVGSGDSLVGAFAAKFMETGDVFESAKWGVAAGSANAAKLESATVTLDEATALLPKVRRQLAEISLQVN
jgi:1-phosphofructokinase family hexose kinase